MAVKSRQLLPSEVVKRWKFSSVVKPCQTVVAICRKHPNEPSKSLVARCVEAGVSKSTATVRVSRWRHERLKGRK